MNRDYSLSVTVGALILPLALPALAGNISGVINGTVEDPVPAGNTGQLSRALSQTVTT